LDFRQIAYQRQIVNQLEQSDSWSRCRKRNYAMSIKRLFDAVECRGDIGRRVATFALPISNRPRVTSSCAGKIGLREPGEHTSGPNLASRDNVAHNQTLYDSGNAATGHPALSKTGPDIRYQMVTCCLACLECWRSLAAVERVLPSGESNAGGRVRGPPAAHPEKINILA
jgi:hypothetical protein